jgi:type I restriction enzyme M protein
MPKLSLAKLERHLYAAADRLRQEGLDAATYKDYIFGMLFLKRCSDVYFAEREQIVGRKVEAGMTKDDAETRYGENHDFYDNFFVPEIARWPYLIDKMGDATEPFGSRLDKALSALRENNEELQHVLDKVFFMEVESGKRVVSDEACKDLVRLFSRYRLRNEDFQFSDLLGAAYEFLINQFAESAGKKGGDFYTPRDVIRLMVRILKPQPGLSVYDPTCGSGGMLIISREFVEQSGGDVTNLRLCGQVNDASAWSICKLNMLLHGVPAADIQLQDTLLHPMHREAGELERFDRVIANPPFSQNYSKSNMEFPERFRWGWAPTTGKKGDLMFAEHMLAVCKQNGMVTTVMPHGVLFRGGKEKEIRKKFLEEDLIEAIISLPQNLFYGAGIPACVLVMRPNLTGKSLNPNKPEDRRRKILFINADAEYHAGRAQNYLRPEHVEKIVSTYDRFEDIPDYARLVSLEEIKSEANDFNLNIRRYVDNSPPPEPHDVRAHLLGGVPVAEVEAKRILFSALGFDPSKAFAQRPDDPVYFDFGPTVGDKAAIRQLIESDAGVRARSQAMQDALTTWWNTHSSQLAHLPTRRNLNAVRREFLNTFVAALQPLGTLDHFKLSGVIATWWTETLPDFKTLLENGFPGVIDGWIDAIADAVEDDEAAGPVLDPFTHKLVLRVMTDYLERIATAKTDIARLKGEKEAFEQSNPPDDADEEELKNWNYAKDLERQIRDIKAENREALKKLKKLETAAAKPHATEADRGASRQASTVLQPVLDRLDLLKTTLAPHDQIKSNLSEARSRFRTLTNEFVNELKLRCTGMGEEQKRELVLELFAQDVKLSLDAAISQRGQELVRFIESLWDKYRLPLNVIEETRKTKVDELKRSMRNLGYVEG